MKIEEFIKKDFLHLLEHNEFYDSLCSPEFKIKLSQFLTEWELIRQLEKNYSPIPFKEYMNLPLAKSVKNDFEWSWRSHSLKTIKSELKGKKNQLILEVGGWNGWLTNHLSEMQNEVVSVDLFSDERDGLSAKKYYKNKWHALQCDTEKLDFLEPAFDVIIVNHALQFMSKPMEYCEFLKTLLNPNGKIILLGLNFYFNPQRKEKNIANFKDYYQTKYGFSVFFKTTKAYLNSNDLAALSKMEFKINRQPGLFLRNFYARLISGKPIYCFGIFNQQ